MIKIPINILSCCQKAVSHTILPGLKHESPDLESDALSNWPQELEKRKLCLKFDRTFLKKVRPY